MRPYTFRFRVASRSVWCMKHYGDNSSCVVEARSWEEAVSKWHSMVRQWKKGDGLGLTTKPVNPSTVEFLDDTGEHTVKELFGKPPARQGALL